MISFCQSLSTCVIHADILLIIRHLTRKLANANRSSVSWCSRLGGGAGELLAKEFPNSYLVLLRRRIGRFLDIQFDQLLCGHP